MATESDTKTKTETDPEAGAKLDKDPEDTTPAAEEPDSGKGADAEAADDDITDAEAADDEAADETSAPSAKSGGWGFGGGAIVSVGLGLASLGGNPLSEMFRERKQLIGQIESSSQQGGGGGSDPVNAVYGAPWHATAMINGIFALLAVVLGGVLLAALANRTGARPWVKAVCVGGLVLGAIGLLVAGGMYFDLFASQPDAPAPQPQPQMPQQ